jgi:hypothetical protein
MIVASPESSFGAGYDHLVPPGQTHLRPYVDAHARPREGSAPQLPAAPSPHLYDRCRKATRINVTAIRKAARIVPLKVPETLETPPRRL